MVGGDPSDMKMAAMGVQMHSGWGALVVVANEDGRVKVRAIHRSKGAFHWSYQTVPYMSGTARVSGLILILANRCWFESG